MCGGPKECDHARYLQVRITKYNVIKRSHLVEENINLKCKYDDRSKGEGVNVSECAEVRKLCFCAH